MIPSKGKRVSKTASIPAPTGGINAKDAVASMKESDAIFMTNWFPSTASVDIRGGYVLHASAITGNVETLMNYTYGATAELWAIVGGEIIEVTDSGDVAAAAVTDLTNSRFEHILMGTAGGNFLMAVNGEDSLQLYDGSAWTEVDATTTPSITNVDTADISSINNFKNRVFLIEKETLKVWYLPVASIAGAASALDLSGIFKLGGYLVSMGNWTIDNSSGIDDYAVFVTSEGEVAIYQGTDPSDASKWALKGTFKIGKPIGARCLIKAGSDIMVLTTDGAFPLSQSLLTDRSQMQNAVTDKITKLIASDISQYGSNFGWQPIIYPSGNKLIINVPEVEGSISIQYVMNTITGAWSKFTEWNAFCWQVLNDGLYFGGVNGVYKADLKGANDNGSEILADVQQAFSYFGKNTAQKHFKMVRQIFLAEADVTPAVVMNTDFGKREPIGSPSFSSGGGAVWDDAVWDEADWETGDTIVSKWQTVTGIGYCGGLRVKTASSGVGVSWQSTDIVYEEGSVL